ncbi:BBE domain-containing protein [Streptosporangium roseum]
MGHGGNADLGRVRTAYDPRDHERLRALKALYDPHNALRVSYNIPPAG